MNDMPASDRFLRISTIALFALAALTYVAPVLDLLGGVQTTLGRINNLSMLFVFLYTGLLFALPAHMRGSWERRLLLTLGGFLSYATIISISGYQNALVTFGGLFVLLGAISAGLGAYVLGKSGKGLHRRLVIFMVATLPALALPPIFIAWNAQAYESFMLNVYGYSNVRVFGYFAASIVVLLSGLTMGVPGRRGRGGWILALHFLCLSFAWSMLFWSGSRAGMVAVAAAIAMSWLIFWRATWAELVLVPLAGLVGAGLSLLYYTPGRWFGLMNRIQDTAERLDAGGVAAASTNRIDMWRWTMDRIMEAPWLGHGYLPMAGLRTPRFNYYHSHNLVLEYWLSFGLVAGSLMLAMALALYIRAAMAARRIGTPAAKALLMLITLLPGYAMFSATLFFPYHLIVFMLALGALIGWDIHLSRPMAEPERPFRPKADWMFQDL